tara:strand:+ start:269 stop:532 length:264 start_codon:yes stop_codon:yes gene_type:complete
MAPKKEEKKIIPEETSSCLEGGSCHWIIEPPNGPTSIGKCKKCGTEREFRNSFEYNTWHGEKPLDKNKQKVKETDKKEDKKEDKKDK